MDEHKKKIRDSIAKSIDQCAIIKVNLLDIEASINQPQLKTLMNNNWEVISSFAIEDKGVPFLMLILRPPNDIELPEQIQKLNYFYFIPLLLIALSAIVQLILTI